MIKLSLMKLAKSEEMGIQEQLIPDYLMEKSPKIDLNQIEKEIKKTLDILVPKNEEGEPISEVVIYSNILNQDINTQFVLRKTLNKALIETFRDPWKVQVKEVR